MSFAAQVVKLLALQGLNVRKRDFDDVAASFPEELARASLQTKIDTVTRVTEELLLAGEKLKEDEELPPPSNLEEAIRGLAQAARSLLQKAERDSKLQAMLKEGFSKVARRESSARAEPSPAQALPNTTDTAAAEHQNRQGGAEGPVDVDEQGEDLAIMQSAFKEMGLERKSEATKSSAGMALNPKVLYDPGSWGEALRGASVEAFMTDFRTRLSRVLTGSVATARTAENILTAICHQLHLCRAAPKLSADFHFCESNKALLVRLLVFEKLANGESNRYVAEWARQVEETRLPTWVTDADKGAAAHLRATQYSDTPQRQNSSNAKRPAPKPSPKMSGN